MIGVSGMRGTVGGTLTPTVVSRMAAAFAVWLKETQQPQGGKHFRVVFGRDSRPSGFWVRDAAAAALGASGVEVIDLDIVTTPGVAMMVKHALADAGVVITASHNPIEWNGLKFLSRDQLAHAERQVLTSEALLAKVSGKEDLSQQLDALDDHVPAGKDHPIEVLHARLAADVTDDRVHDGREPAIQFLTVHGRLAGLHRFGGGRCRSSGWEVAIAANGDS